MKTFARVAALVIPLAFGLGTAQAQFSQIPHSYQDVTASANGDSKHDQADGATGAGLSVTAAGRWSGGTQVSDATATTAMGPGYVSGSVNTSFYGPGSASARAETYMGDSLVFSSNAENDGRAIVHFSLMLDNATAAAITPQAPGADGANQAGLLHTLLVLGINNRYASWESFTSLYYDGTMLTQTLRNSSGPNERISGLFNFSIDVDLNQAVPLDFYMLLTSDLNAGHAQGSGSAAASLAPAVYWNGISKVTREDGSLLDYSVTSRSGLNYAISAAPLLAPEPASWLLAMLGLVPMVVWHRRRNLRESTDVLTRDR